MRRRAVNAAVVVAFLVGVSSSSAPPSEVHAQIDPNRLIERIDGLLQNDL